MKFTIGPGVYVYACPGIEDDYKEIPKITTQPVDTNLIYNYLGKQKNYEQVTLNISADELMEKVKQAAAESLSSEDGERFFAKLLLAIFDKK